MEDTLNFQRLGAPNLKLSRNTPLSLLIVSVKYKAALYNGCPRTHNYEAVILPLLLCFSLSTLLPYFLSLPVDKRTHAFVWVRRQEKHQSCPIMWELRPVQHRQISLHPAVVSDSSCLISTPNHSKGTDSRVKTQLACWHHYHHSGFWARSLLSFECHRQWHCHITYKEAEREGFHLRVHIFIYFFAFVS